MTDHVHLLVKAHPQYGINKLIKEIKGKSSKAIRDKYVDIRAKTRSLWTNSCFVSTVGGAPFSVINKYVENEQKL